MITDVLIIGGGGAGARCAIECNKNVIIASKGLFGKSGCTVMAEGGYNAVINKEDSFEKHFEDTMKGGGYINDEKLVKILVENAPKELKNLENFGALFDKKDNENLAQRPFGGQSFNRTCYSGDRTGQEIITGLMEYITKKNNIKIMEDITAIKLIVKNNICYGAIFINNITGQIFPIFAKATVIATGGAGQIYPITSNPIQKVGDGFALAYNEGAILKDMEMIQFHPTGMVGTGTLVTEAVRGEGGILYNKNKERFMEKYDSVKMELSTRDVVAKAIYNEIIEGRGVNNEGVYLDVSHLNEDTIKHKLETMYRQFLDVGIDITKEPMVVSPTAHHTMGGIKINENCETNIIGLFACGEVTGGIHGANRLGGNALADTQVFGAIAGKSANKHCEIVNEIKYYNLEKANEYKNNLIKNIKNEIFNLKNTNNNTNNNENIYNLIDTLKEIMWKYVSIVRSEKGLNNALNEINKLKSKKENLKLNNLVEVLKYFDFKSMLIVSELIVKCALIRKESRGAHYMVDYPKTNNKFKGNTIAHNGKITFVPLNEK